MRAVRQCWVVAVILAGMFSAGLPLEAQVRRALFASAVPGWMHKIEPGCVASATDGSGAVGVGDPVARLFDISGNGNDTIFETSTARPILRQDTGGHYYLEPDGVDDFGRFTDVPVPVGTSGLIAGMAASETSSGSTHVFISSRTGGVGYIGRNATGWYYRSSSSAPIASGLPSTSPASVIASARGGVAYLRIGDSEFSGTFSAGINPYGVLFRYDAGDGSLYAKGRYYGGVLAIHEPSTSDMALVKRWLDKLRGA